MKNEPAVVCDGDSCDVSAVVFGKNLDAAAAMRVSKWAEGLKMDPADYDMPGSTARETGV